MHFCTREPELSLCCHHLLQDERENICFAFSDNGGGVVSKASGNDTHIRALATGNTNLRSCTFGFTVVDL